MTGARLLEAVGRRSTNEDDDATTCRSASQLTTCWTRHHRSRLRSRQELARSHWTLAEATSSIYTGFNLSTTLPYAQAVSIQYFEMNNNRLPNFISVHQ